MLTRRIPNFCIRLNDKLLRIAAAAALFGLLVPGLAAAQAPPTPPPWNPGGGTVDPKDPNLWHNPKDGPSDYVWNPKICRWVYKAAGKDAVGNHKAGDVATQGPPQGVPPGTGKMTGPGTAKDGSGNTYTWDDDTTDTKGVVTPGKGWVDDKTGKPLCTPPAAAAVAPGANPGPAPQNVPGQGCRARTHQRHAAARYDARRGPGLGNPCCSNVGAGVLQHALQQPVLQHALQHPVQRALLQLSAGRVV